MRILHKLSQKVPFVCGVFLVAVLLIMLGTEMLYRATGKVEERFLTIADFEPLEVELPEEGVVITAGADPRLILHEPGVVRRLMVQVDFSANPGELQGYYATKPDVYSEKQKVYAEYIGDGWYLFELPYSLQPIRSLRMDLGVIPSITVTFGEMRLNTPDTLEAWVLRMVPRVFYTVVGSVIVCLGGRVLYESSESRLKWRKKLGKTV